MAGRGWFLAVSSGEVEWLLTQPYEGRRDFLHTRTVVAFDLLMDKAWVAIHRALSDGTLYGLLGEPPLSMAVLGDHLICQTPAADFLYLKYPSEVTEIAKELQGLSDEAFEEKLAAMPEPDDDTVAMGLSLVPDEIEYVGYYFEEMRRFYQRASEERLAAVFYWG